MGAKGKKEIKHLALFQDKFVPLNRLIVPTVAILLSIGQVCMGLRSSGKLDPANPKHYNGIAIAFLARQIGATLITENVRDFGMIGKIVGFDFQIPLITG